MVQPKYTPQEALERVKLMMRYDMSKTLTENVDSKNSILKEQVSASEAASISNKVHKILSGDVETEDLDELSSLLTSAVFGKTSQDGNCLLVKIMQYYSKSGVLGTPGGGLFGSGDMLKDITNSTEIGEPEFDDVKQELIKKINDELSKFCKTGKIKTDGGGSGGGGTSRKTTNWKSNCSGTYTQGCESSKVGEVQSCLGGLTVDNKFGPRTAAKLKEKGFGESFTDADVAKICAKKEDKPEIGGEVQQNKVEEM